IELEARLIDDLLDLTRITHGKLALTLAELDVHEILNDAISTVSNEIEKKQISLKLGLSDGSHKILGDGVRLQQVFWNVLKNAVKFTHQSGQISVDSQTLPGNKILINIRDTGIGMGPEEIERIFDAFSQGSHHFGGLGLGLAISRSLVELHSGSIRASSPGKGMGAIFSIELPLANLTEKANPAGLPPAPAALAVNEEKSAQRLHILLVEDHEPTRSILTQLLLQRHYTVTSAASFVQACSLMENNIDFELLISDIGLPDGSGFDLMGEFQRKFGAKGIALTGYGAEQDVAQSRASGFTVHLTKPISVESLESALAGATRT
ncbi:MAG TPA: ATP-binding protein, partial [Verrucomicrobiae bacterium]|nr:ATP-binding protein [Verrucomicrobiae bacterium]